MDSKSRRLPFTVSSPSSSSSSLSTSSSSALGAGRLYGRASVLANDGLSRGTLGKLDSDYKGTRLSAVRDYSSSESCHSRWKPSTPSSSSSSSFLSADRPWMETSYGGRSKPLNGDSERGLGSYSGVLGASQDGESKRAKLSYTNRAAYGRSVTSASSSTCSTRSSLGTLPGE